MSEGSSLEQVSIFVFVASRFENKTNQANRDGHQPHDCPNQERAQRGFGGDYDDPNAEGNYSD
jgi:hypothetical protein